MKIHDPIFLSLICVCIVLTVTNCGLCISTEAPSMLCQFQEKVLKRRTRSFVFPKKGQLLLTPVFAKAILGGIPKGLTYSMEFDMYHPLPDTVEGWKPTILLNQIGKKQKVEENLTVLTTNSSTVTGSGNVSQNYANNEESYHFPVYDDVEYGTNPWAYYNTMIDSDPSLIFSHQENPHIERSSQTRSHARRFHTPPIRKPVDFQANEAADANPLLRDGEKLIWHNNQNLRERRQIFDQLEKLGRIFQIDMNSCIQRAMCEIKTHLPPFGESLMHDVMRIILTIPKSSKTSSENESPDEYGRQYANVNCALRFSVSCPYPVLPFLVKGFSRL
ncbi:uncharacterized protein LOC133336021 [Musca vetustissima]|uniref:uncharacterized protein LOC133336021 n=1 Tax=Musca vetustissima TaxID=27455 RepID=UPI002AB78CCF|nr:uncharacterized protein LOC133336021 [Musca vetustissima]